MSDTMQIQGVLAAFAYGFMSGSKTNQVITNEVLAEKGAESDAGKWSDKLFPTKTCGKRNAYIDVRRHLSKIRNFHYANTYMFEESIWRVLPEKRIEAYKMVVDQGKTEAYELLEKFLVALPEMIEKAKAGRGEAFQESDYPTADMIRAKFHYSVDYRPIPSSTGLNAIVMQEAIDKLNALHAQRLAEANSRLIKEFIEPFQLLSEQLKNPEHRKMGTVLDSIRDFAAKVPSMDLSGNSELVEIAQQIQVTFSELTPELIRKDEELQKFIGNVSESVVQNLNRFGQLGSRRFS